MLHSVQPKRSSTRVEKVMDAGCCPVCSTLTAKCFASLSGIALAAAFATNTLAVGLAFWLMLGSLYGYLVERFAQRATATAPVTA